MLRQQTKTLVLIQMIVDLSAVVLSFLIAYLIIETRVLEFLGFGGLYSFSSYVWLLIIILPFWAALLKLNDAYNPRKTSSYYELILNNLKLVTLGILFAGTVIYSVKVTYISRPFIFLFGVINFLLLIATKIGMTHLLKRFRRRGYHIRRVLMVGSGKRAREFTDIINSHLEWGLVVHGFVDDKPLEVDVEVLGDRLIGKIIDIPKILKETVIDEVIFVTPRRMLDNLEDIITYCEEVGIETTIVADFFDLNIAEIYLSKIDNKPLLSFCTTPSNEWELLAKRTIDFCGALVLLILFLPLISLVSLIIKLTSTGPVIFEQKRCGLYGREFEMLKFRSMVADAEERRNELEYLNEMAGPVFKIKDDPRVTKIGWLLRKTSLDELPQIINVLKGEMSLVGPRPPIPTEVDKYDRWQRRRLSMKPGIACLWQVNGRNNINFEDWIRLDLEYIDNWSLALDFKILLKTVPVVLLGHGAS